MKRFHVVSKVPGADASVYLTRRRDGFVFDSEDHKASFLSQEDAAEALKAWRMKFQQSGRVAEIVEVEV